MHKVKQSIYSIEIMRQGYYKCKMLCFLFMFLDDIYAKQPFYREYSAKRLFVDNLYNFSMKDRLSYAGAFTFVRTRSGSPH